MIPGTHNSGAYSLLRTWDVFHWVWSRWIYCQEEDVWNQLVYGNRALDIRVGHASIEGSAPDPSRDFWVYHETVKMKPLRTIVRDVRDFVIGTREVVILDFHRFPVGFDGLHIHLKLIGYIERELGPWLIRRNGALPPSEDLLNTPIGRLLEGDRRILVAYSHDDIHRDDFHGVDFLWPGVRHLWANTEEPSRLRDHLEEHQWKSCEGRLCASMAHLTVDFDFHSAINLRKSVRSLARDIQGNVTQWLRDRWWDSANIVSTDYFLSNDVIHVAIEANRRRGRL